MDNSQNTAVDVDTTGQVLPAEKAQSPWMIGLLLMIFGSLGLSVSAMNLYLGAINLGGFRDDWTSLGLGINYIYFSLVVGIVASTWLIYIAARILGYKDNGRRQFGFYMIYLVVWTLGTSIYQYMMVPDGFSRQAILSSMLPEFIGKLLMVLFFVACLYLLNKRETRQWLT